MRYHKIPDETIRRLPVYLRQLLLLQQKGSTGISSRSFSNLVHIADSQIRKDFSYFGDFGVRGRGYDIKKLIREIKKILKLNSSCVVAIAGAGRLGSAILGYPGFKKYGFKVSCAFDADKKKIGKKIHGLTIRSDSKINSLEKRKIKLAIIATPSDVAQNVTDKLVKAGVCGILNFAPCTLTAPKKVKIINIDIAMDLATLPYYLPLV
ncbi:MAG: redox-sensing transcriptional repressor Rex [Planctomycetes bacterium]|nr:redox-sensing transcriptional repressor Rex [Planctomycetota bacterium]MBU1518900.1 redox-sensing transcriptional repressor Rex [Planctomycetota bacterium]MBU2457142.1 redox-sensing transcriptional repressor Rex [Planctomycetota bacterium]MBU2596103.1 redox-sensing transcriptional repressor Rex [Planctomycetota bacterium]